MNVLVLHSQVPFVRGGAEVLVDGLLDALRACGHIADVVSLPLSWNPVEGLLTSALAWRMLDLSRFNDRRVDRVICTKYPTWAVAHPHKALWLIHQHRQAYDLHGTALSDFAPHDTAQDVRRRLVEIDRVGLAECRPRYAISRNVADRLRRFNGLDAIPLYPPVRAGLTALAYQPFILSVARLDAAKRVAPLVAAWEHVSPSLSLVVVGDGPDRFRIEEQVGRRGLSARITLLGRVDDTTLTELFNNCRAVYYAPVDEDYGFTAVEALSAGKAVITAPDSGGVLEFIVHEVNGLVTQLDAQPLAAAISQFADEGLARALGGAGFATNGPSSWRHVVDCLLDG